MNLFQLHPALVSSLLLLDQRKVARRLLLRLLCERRTSAVPVHRSSERLLLPAGEIQRFHLGGHESSTVNQLVQLPRFPQATLPAIAKNQRRGPEQNVYNLMINVELTF